MLKVNIYDIEGKETGSMELNPSCFGVEVKPELVHEAVVAQEANSRRVLAHVKTRGEVRGGGKKPWKQKGTGRARHGSSRSPIWIGGGVTHGPNDARNFAKKINRKVKQKALCMALSDRVTDKRFIVLESSAYPETKTKCVASTLTKLPLHRETLYVIPESNPTLLRMVRNIQRVKLVTVNTLNVRDVVRYPTVLFEKGAVEKFEKTYGTV